jgi:hypothetical protein
MNFIRDRELALRLKNNAVSSKEKFIYLLLSGILTTIPLSSFYGKVTEYNQWDICSDIATFVIVIAGAFVCYRTNKRGDDKEFIERYICIGFPVGIQTGLLALVLFIFFMILIAIHGDNYGDGGNIYSFSLMSLSYLYYYWRLNLSIKVAAT